MLRKMDDAKFRVPIQTRYAGDLTDPELRDTYTDQAETDRR